MFKSGVIYNHDAYLEVIREKYASNITHENKFHMTEAINWLKRAQDATLDNGVSRGFSVAWHPYFNKKGWQNSYPETTGYIIPTFFDCADYFNDRELFNRAFEMAKWEIEVQMKEGAIRGGVVNDGEDVPAVFCTGQVIFGWIRAFKETKESCFLQSAKKAGDYLITIQNDDGIFREADNYRYANKLSTVYHTRVAWALILLGKTTGNDKYIEAGIKNIEFGLRNQERNGWFNNNCLSNAEKALLHTICYALRGILEASFLLDSERYFDASILTANALISVIEREKYMPGCLDKKWNRSAPWSCLTGNAQLAIIWLKLYQKTQNRVYLDSAHKVIQFLKGIQNCVTSNQGLRGGIKGSYPFSGAYGRFEILNWATKFFIDALLLEDLIQKNERQYQ